MDADTQDIDIKASVMFRRADIWFNWVFDTANTSVFPKNIISIEKKASNFGCRVILDRPFPTHLMTQGRKWQ